MTTRTLFTLGVAVAALVVAGATAHPPLSAAANAGVGPELESNRTNHLRAGRYIVRR